MRITDIHIKNYRAFYGEHHFCLDNDGKNLMIYGENGSGKSSLFTALHDFFRSSVSKVDLEENIFISSSQKDTSSIKLEIKESPTTSKTTSFELKKTDREIISSDRTLISDANKINGFFDYKRLLQTYLGHKNKVDLFEILLDGILYHSINRFTNSEIGKEIDLIYHEIYQEKQYPFRIKNIKNYLEKFNLGFKQLLKDIETDTNTFIKYFGINVKVSLGFNEIEYIGRASLKGNNINLYIEFYDKSIPKHQDFLNEARLSALAISLYLASIKVNPVKGALKVLVLDDLLIGLDMSNRMPLLKILAEHFTEPKNKDEQFQIIMTTYDKVWYELVRNYYGPQNWKYYEIYSKSLKDEDFEIPIIFNEKGYLEKAKYYLDEKDYKASAVYIRTEFERLVKNICDVKKLVVEYNKNPKEIKSGDFWQSIKDQTNLDPVLIHEIEIHRGTVMNPFSHYDLQKPEFKQELVDTIAAVKKLGLLNPKSLQRATILEYKKRINQLEQEADKQRIVADRLRDIIKKPKTVVSIPVNS